ncbi:cupin-like domain-containing protein [Streptomyces sp. BF23-19]|uniref:cupin-like domain-containing protein n=1 Tax=unclassified Streptomyces TaxID=2593676 RepID=UPI0034E42485
MKFDELGREFDIPLISEKFWDEIMAATDGGAKPAVISLGELQGKIFPVTDILDLAAAVFQDGDVSVNADGSMLTEPKYSGRVPSTVADFEQFILETAAANDAESIILSKSYCLKYSDRVAMMARSFISGYVERLGIPDPGINAVLIAGHYKETWIGLHNDFCSTFLNPVYGRKKVMMWPPEYFDEVGLEKTLAVGGYRFGRVDVDPYAKDAVTFSVEPGEFLFIPANWWHYNRLPGRETSLALSLGIFADGTVRENSKRALSVALESDLGKQTLEPWNGISAGTIDSLESIELPNQLEGLMGAIRENLLIQMLARSSARGVIAGGSAFRDARPIASDSILQGRSDAPVILLKQDDGSGLLFALGAIIKIRSAAQVEKFVSQLATGKPFNILKTAGPGEAAKAAEELSSWLYVRGGVEIIG